MPYDPIMPPLGINPKKIKTLRQKDTCTLIFKTPLLIITKMQKQPKGPFTDDR